LQTKHHVGGQLDSYSQPIAGQQPTRRGGRQGEAGRKVRQWTCGASAAVAGAQLRGRAAARALLGQCKPAADDAYQPGAAPQYLAHAAGAATSLKHQ
jgi:hypothetical protein